MSNILDIIENGCHRKCKRSLHIFGMALLSECVNLYTDIKLLPCQHVKGRIISSL